MAGALLVSPLNRSSNNGACTANPLYDNRKAAFLFVAPFRVYSQMACSAFISLLRLKCLITSCLEVSFLAFFLNFLTLNLISGCHAIFCEFGYAAANKAISKM